MKRGPVFIGAAIVAAAGFLVVKEGVVLQTYADPVLGWEVPTACAGQTGPHIQRGQVFTRDECMAMLDATTRQKARELERCVQWDITPNAAAAVLSLAYNVGTPTVCRSTLVRQINAGAPPAQYCEQFRRWVFVGGRDCRDPRNNCRGIVNRREAERAMCLT